MRVLQVYKTINDADSTKTAAASIRMNQLGQLKQKQLRQVPARGFWETQDYAYNIRGC